jgi:hypothetical protein
MHLVKPHLKSAVASGASDGLRIVMLSRITPGSLGSVKVCSISRESSFPLKMIDLLLSACNWTSGVFVKVGNLPPGQE